MDYWKNWQAVSADLPLRIKALSLVVHGITGMAALGLSSCVGFVWFPILSFWLILRCYDVCGDSYSKTRPYHRYSSASAREEEEGKVVDSYAEWASGGTGWVGFGI